MFLQSLGEDALKGFVTAFLLEEGVPGHCAIQHMIHQAARSVSGTARHAASLPEQPAHVNINESRPLFFFALGREHGIGG
jgi:hypothetical protein